MHSKFLHRSPSVINNRHGSDIRQRSPGDVLSLVPNSFVQGRCESLSSLSRSGFDGCLFNLESFDIKRFTSLLHFSRISQTCLFVRRSVELAQADSSHVFVLPCGTFVYRSTIGRFFELVAVFLAIRAQKCRNHSSTPLQRVFFLTVLKRFF